MWNNLEMLKKWFVMVGLFFLNLKNYTKRIYW